MARDATSLPAAGDGPHDVRARLAREIAASERLDAELAALPAWGSAACASWLAQHDLSTDLSLGALVHLLRHAAEDDAALAQTLFIAILRRSEHQSAAWARRTASRSLLPAPLRESLREDLKQELTLYLWQRLARERDPAWERYFAHALDFAQRHVARSYMARNGYWPTGSASAHPARLPPILLSALRVRYGEHDESPSELLDSLTPFPVDPFDPVDPFTPADLADLRDLVAQLPYRERVAVVMRIWLCANEREIGATLSVTARTVRNLLSRAYTRLRREYSGDVVAGGGKREASVAAQVE